MLRLIFSAAAFTVLITPAVFAAPAASVRSISVEAPNSHVVHVAARQQRHAKGPSQALKGIGRTVKDTCPGGDEKCIKDLIANCDKAGGGLSTQPDGGVDCYVVGIHDQP
jgi:hypothetical protein